MIAPDRMIVHGRRTDLDRLDGSREAIRKARAKPVRPAHFQIFPTSPAIRKCL
jgi:hypothetical protein